MKMMKTLLRSILLAAVMGAALTPGARAADASDSRREAMEMKIQELRERLALTPDQERQLAPILQERNEKMKELWSRHGADSSRRARRAMLKEARRIQEDFTRKIEPVLTDDQRREWEAAREKARSEAIARYRSRRN